MDLFGLIGSGISAIGGLIGQNIGNKKALQAVRETNQANRELAEYSYSKDLEMWNRQNDYNTPYNQMQRLKDAGLNPNLMYGQGNTGNASNMPSYDAPRMEAYTDFGDFGATRAGQQMLAGLVGYANIKKTEAEEAYIRQNTQNLEANKRLTELQIIQQGFQNAKSEIEKDSWRDLYRAKIAEMDSSIVNNFSRAELNDSQRFFTDAQRERFEALTPLVRDTVKADLNQKLFDLYHLSPAKLSNIIADTNYKKFLQKLVDFKGQLLFNELEFSNERLKYKSDYADFEHYMKESEVYLEKVLRDHGLNPKSGNLNTLLYEIYQTIVKPLENL